MTEVLKERTGSGLEIHKAREIIRLLEFSHMHSNRDIMCKGERQRLYTREKKIDRERNLSSKGEIDSHTSPTHHLCT